MRITAFIVSFIAFFAFLPLRSVTAEADDSFTYEIIDETASITGYLSPKSFRGVLPEKLGGVSVTSIAPKAFENNYFIEAVTIPAGIKEIGDNAFAGCIYLEEIELTAGLEEIGAYAFANTAPTVVSIPDGVTRVGDYAFEGCYALADVEVADSVTEIGEFAFEDTAWLANATEKMVVVGDGVLIRILGEETQITIPESVKVISGGAAEGATLRELVIPESVKRIENWAFASCAELSSVTFLGEPDYIAGFAFYSTPWLVEYPNDCITIGKKYYKYTGKSAQAEIPDGVEVISPSAFEGNESLVSVTIPDSVTEIGDNAFYGCGTLKTVKLPDGLKKIGESCFYNCRSLSEVTLPNGIEIIGRLAFSSCTSLKSINIPDSVTELGELSVGMLYDSERGFTAISDGDSEFIIVSQNKLADEYAKANGIRSMTDEKYSGYISDKNHGVLDKDMLPFLLVAIFILAAAYTIICIKFIAKKKK